MDARQRKFIIDLTKKPAARKESGLFVIEGPRTASETDPEIIEDIFVTADFLKGPFAARCSGILDRGYTIISLSEMAQISDTVTPQGILITARQRNYRDLKEFAAAERAYAAANNILSPLLLVLETLQDPGNLGTIIRMAEAAGVSGVIADTGTADVYSPKVVRATMGAVMRLPYISVSDLREAVRILGSGRINEWGRVRTMAAALTKAACHYTSMDFTVPSAVMIGNEAHGLSRALTGCADTAIIIPMMGQAESLNAAVAAAVIVFEAARQRRNLLF